MVAKGKKRSAPKAGAGRKGIERLRGQIDRTDDQILELLNRRARLAQAVGRLKRQSNRAYYHPAREEEIFERLSRRNSGPFPTASVRPVFREIISACRSLEKRIAVAYLGPEATFTHLAARRQFGHRAEFLPEQSITEVFEEVERGRADYGVVPIENSTEGVVSHTLDMFLDSPLQIYAEIVLEVRHNLLSKSGRLEAIKRLYSHRQAAAQCRQWLRKHLPSAPILEVASTAEAARRAARDLQAGAIASEYAADVYRLKVLERGIEDQTNNFTRFLVIGFQPGLKSGNDITSIMFSVKDQPGILWRALGSFARRGINLSKIESRPLKGKAWEYVFFVEMDGHVSEPRIQKALAALEKYAVFVKVLGSFPKARTAHQQLEV